MTRIFLLAYSKELPKWWRMALILLTVISSTLGCRVMEDFYLCKLDDLWHHIRSWHKKIKSHKKWNITEDFFCIQLKLCTVVTVTTKFHDRSILTFPWWLNGFQALFIQNLKSEFSSYPSRSVICLCCSFSGCEQIWTIHKAQAQSPDK